MLHRVDGVLVRWDAEQDLAPVVFDSPHSGTLYPKDFDPTCPISTLRQAEDTYVDELFGAAPGVGAPLLAALFPRSYIDVNRALDDIDPELLSDPWPEPLRPTEKSRMGMGLIRRTCKPGVPMYARRLTATAVARRINTYYRPYHDELTALLDRAYRRFGAVWHLNLHSMPSVGSGAAADHSWERADFVLGDRDGSTCAPDFTRVVSDTLTRMGYSVKLNDPYKGVELVRRYGHPRQGRHSLQLEVNRRLYMNENTLAKSANFDRLKAQMTQLIELICAYSRDQLMAAAAD
jgi:N-formylglutamate deformylase